VASKLVEKADLFVEYTRWMGLSMKAGKTQLLLSSRAGNVADTTVELNGSVIYPGDVIELLGVKYEWSLLTGPHVKALLAAVRQQASVIARLADHLPGSERSRPTFSVEKSHFSTLNVGLAGTGNLTQATCLMLKLMSFLPQHIRDMLKL
jgi:hypothetical protein